MGDRWRLWEVFLEEGPACGRLVLAGLVLALFAVGFAIHAAPRTRTWWGRLATLGPAVLLTSASLVSVASIVDEARDRHLAELLTTSAWFRSPWPAGAEHAWLGVLVVFLALRSSALHLRRAAMGHDACPREDRVPGAMCGRRRDRCSW